MKSFDAFCAGLACPSDDFELSFVEQVVVGYAENLLSALLESDRTRIAARSRGLTELLCSAGTTLNSFDEAWDLSFGELASAMMSGGSDVCQAAAAVAIRMHQWGLEGEWELALNQPAYFQFDRWLILARERLMVQAIGGTVLVGERGGRDAIVRLRRDAGGWRADEGRALPIVEHDGGPWIICGADCISSPSVAEQLLKAEARSVVSAEFANDAREFASVCTSAIQLIGGASPTYLSWVSRVLRKVVLIPLTSEITNSASAFLAPGMIAVSTRQPRLTLVEMLVHEASHQYLYIARRLGALDDGSDTKLYYSPFKRTARPLLYIVFAFHAFANVLLFYRQLLQSDALAGEERNGVVKRVGEIETNVALLHSHIVSSPAVTRLGDSLVEPLARELAKLGSHTVLQR